LLSISPVREFAPDKTPGKSTIANSPILPVAAIALLAVAVHGPLLLMQLPAQSQGGSAQIFLAQHYARSWFNLWNEQWFAGFSQASHPPLTQQWVALVSHLTGITAAFMLVQLCVIMFLALGVFRFARLWVDDLSASFAAIGSIFLGSLSMLVYQSGQLPATAAAALALHGAAYLYAWSRRANFLALITGFLLLVAAATADHVTALFGIALFTVPAAMLAIIDRKNVEEVDGASAGAVFVRAALMLAAAALVAAVVLAPFWISFFGSPQHLVVPDGSRENFLLNFSSALNFWLIPVGAILLALPYVFLSGSSDRRLRPLFFAFYIALVIGLGSTTPVAKMVLGRHYDSLPIVQFTFWATLLALPFVGELATRLIERYSIKASIALWIAAVLSFAMPLIWMNSHPVNKTPFRTENIVLFLNRDGHDRFRYLTLGFGPQFAEVSTRTNASTVDGDPTVARMLPEVSEFGATHLDAARSYGSAGMEALRAVLKHASQYGLKFVFVRDRYYEPLLAFAGWRQVESYENGNVTLWSKEDVPPARKISPDPSLVVNGFQETLWGIVPVLCSLLAFALMALTPKQRRSAETIPFPAANAEPSRMQEAR